MERVFALQELRDNIVLMIIKYPIEMREDDNYHTYFVSVYDVIEWLNPSAYMMKEYYKTLIESTNYHKMYILKHNNKTLFDRLNDIIVKDYPFKFKADYYCNDHYLRTMGNQMCPLMERMYLFGLSELYKDAFIDNEEVKIKVMQKYNVELYAIIHSKDVARIISNLSIPQNYNPIIRYNDMKKFIKRMGDYGITLDMLSSKKIIYAYETSRRKTPTKIFDRMVLLELYEKDPFNWLIAGESYVERFEVMLKNLYRNVDGVSPPFV